MPVKASSEQCCLLKGLCQNSPLLTPLVLPPHPPRPDPSLDTRRKPSGQFLPYLDRYKYIIGLRSVEKTPPLRDRDNATLPSANPHILETRYCDHLYVSTSLEHGHSKSSEQLDYNPGQI